MLNTSDDVRSPPSPWLFLWTCRLDDCDAEPAFPLIFLFDTPLDLIVALLEFFDEKGFRETFSALLMRFKGSDGGPFWNPRHLEISEALFGCPIFCPGNFF